MRKPYGTLVGVRPGKLVDQMLELGFEPGEIVHRLQLERHVEKEKAKLLVEVSLLQHQLLSSLQNRHELISLYINIPFCPSRCAYCSFASHSLEQYRACERQTYLDGVRRELAAVNEWMELANLKLCTIYIGGGTPTVLSADQLQLLLGEVQVLPRFESQIEITVEAGRPETITADKLAVLPSHTRVSINPQSMHNATLQRIGRKHTVEDFRAGFALARRSGITNINTDLIIGLPAEGPAGIAYSLSEVAALRPDSITVHMFSPKRASRFTAGDRWEPMPSLEAETASQHSADTLRELGMRPYYLYRQRGILAGLENIGWAVPGKECLYNILVIGETQTIIGVGAGASSIFPLKVGTWDRHHNPKDAKVYLQRLDQCIEDKRVLLNKWRSRV